MNKIKLNHSPILFNEEAHTYEYNGEEYSGVTSILSKLVFPKYYDNVPEKVLEQARLRGTAVHNELQLEWSGIHSDSPEAEAYRKLVKQYKLKQIAAEYLVSDNELHIASSIDSVLQVGDNEVALVDYKTTAELNIEYLRWQLSIYQYLFGMQNKQLYITKLYAIHLPKPNGGVCDAKLVEIEPISTDDLIYLFNCYRYGDTFVNPLHVSDNDVLPLVDKYAELDKQYKELKAQMDALDEQKKALLARVKTMFDVKHQTTWTNDNYTITRTADSDRKTFKRDLIADKIPAKWLKLIDEQGYQITHTEGNIRVTIKQ